MESGCYFCLVNGCASDKSPHRLMNYPEKLDHLKAEHDMTDKTLITHIILRILWEEETGIEVANIGKNKKLQ